MTKIRCKLIIIAQSSLWIERNHLVCLPPELYLLSNLNYLHCGQGVFDFVKNFGWTNFGQKLKKKLVKNLLSKTICLKFFPTEYFNKIILILGPIKLKSDYVDTLVRPQSNPFYSPQDWKMSKHERLVVRVQMIDY